MTVDGVGWALVAVVTVFGVMFVVAALVTLRDYLRWRRAVNVWLYDPDDDGPPPPWPR